MSSMRKAAESALVSCLGVKKNEKVLIVTDHDKRSLAQIFFEVSKRYSKNSILIEMKPGKIHGEEPPDFVAIAMKKADVCVLMTSKSLSHTNARKKASKTGARIVSMPNINKKILMRCVDADYFRIKKLTNELADVIDKGKDVRIITDAGTDISFSIKGRKAHGRNAGLFLKKGEWGNLPEGEACLAPVEKSANGVYVIDTSSPLGDGILKRPIKIFVKEGYAIKIEGGDEAKKLAGTLKKYGKESYNIAELGIGTNYKAKISGNVLEDEKVLGTCHIALGNSLSMGGKMYAPVHLDGVIRNPTINIDGKMIMKKGKLLI